MPPSANLHDRFFRHALGRPEVAKAFFERYLPTAVTAQLDIATLTLANDSYVDQSLKTQHSDLLFRVQRVDGQPALLYLLLEHKSYPDAWVALQLLGYLVRIWERERQNLNRPPLPTVIPLVLYHGDRPWEIVPEFLTLMETPTSLAGFMPNFHFVLCDLNQDQLDNLQQRAWLAITLQVLKYGRSDELAERLPEILGLFRELFYRRDDALAYLETVLRYLAQASGQLSEFTLRQALDKALPSDVGETVMSTLAETWVAQGLEQGLEQGLQQGTLDTLRTTLRRQLTRRFGSLSESVDGRIEDADQATLAGWLDRVIEASSIDDVLGGNEPS